MRNSLVLEELEPYVDAMNIDLKGDAAFYRELGGSYEQVKAYDRIHACSLSCGDDILIIPGKNDRKNGWRKKRNGWPHWIRPSPFI